jgi:transposase
MSMRLADPAAVGLPPTAAEHLPDDVDTLKRMVLELLASLHEHRRDNEALRHRLDLLLRRLYGPRGERFDPDQRLLFAETAAGQDTAPAAPTEPAAPSQPQRRCRPHGRRRLPEGLPREPRHHELPEAERVCRGCGRVRIDIGADKSEQLDYRPASLIVIEHFVHKYVCPCCSRQSLHAQGQQPEPGHESEPMPAQQPEPQPPAMPYPVRADPGEVVIAAPKPAMPIAKGLPGPGLLAHLVVSKYTDHSVQGEAV